MVIKKRKEKSVLLVSSPGVYEQDTLTFAVSVGHVHHIVLSSVEKREARLSI